MIGDNMIIIKQVICRSDWPELDQPDFVVFSVREGETDEAAIERAKLEYPGQTEFYIQERVV
jgi:hypothetical protein